MNKIKEFKNKRTFECADCKGRKFVLTEAITIVTSMVVNTDKIYAENVEFKTNQVTKQYTLICINCGKTYFYTEKDFVDFTKLFNEGIIFDVKDILIKMQKEGVEGKCNI